MIAGLIGLTTSMTHTLITEKRELKKIKTCLKNEIGHTISLIDRKQIEFELLIGNDDIDCNRSKEDWNEIRQQFDSGRAYLKMSLIDSIYSNNNAFRLSDQQLTIIQNIQVSIKDYNDNLQQWYDIVTKILNEQFDSTNLDNQNTHRPLIKFFSKHIELNADIKTELENLKRQWENPIPLKDFEKSVISDWRKEKITKMQAENMMCEKRGYKVQIKEQDGKDPKVVRSD